MDNFVQKHPYLIACLIVVVLCIVGGTKIALVGAEKENIRMMQSGIHFAVWPSIIYIAGVGFGRVSRFFFDE